jgi:predicted dehydrogenase
MTMPDRTRLRQGAGAQACVAILGGTGIGKHHGKWYALEGCEVVAFLGSRPRTLERTATAMRNLFGFTGQAYSNLDELLAKEMLDAVSVCTPHHLHKEHTIKSLRAGLHVLCEKPLVWDGDRSSEQMLADGEEMLAEAQKARRVLAVNCQYLAALPLYREIYEMARGPWDKMDHLFVQMESKGGVAGPNEYDEIWIDLASHPLSLVLGLLPDAELVPESVDCVIAQHSVHAHFEMLKQGHQTAVHIALNNIFEGTPARRLCVNEECMVDIAGRNDEQGIYRAYLCQGDTERQCEDLVHLSVRRFLTALHGQGEPLGTAEQGLENLRLQLAIYDRATRV